MKKMFFRSTRFVSAMMILVFCTLMMTGAYAADTTSKAQGPHLKDGKTKFRVAYCEPYAYAGYAEILYYMMQALAEEGWVHDVEKMPYEAGQKETADMWKYLTENNVSDYIEFPADAYYTFNSSTDDDKKIRNGIFDRFNSKKDIDLFIVMGTKAANKVANTSHNVPSLVFSTSNAVQSGIIKSAEDSGYDNVWAHMDPSRYTRQVQVFYDMFNFKKLGMIYEDSDDGRTIASIDDVKKVAESCGFEIVSRYVKSATGDTDIQRFERDYLAACKDISSEVDAVYLTTNSKRDVKKLPQFLAPFMEKKIPVFSQDGQNEVKYGALLSLAKADQKGMGRFAASTAIGVLNGKTARSLSQIYENTPTIALNLKVAKEIGYKPPFEILLVADQIYTEVEDDKN